MSETTTGQSAREADLVKIAERGVIEAARKWQAIWREVPPQGTTAQSAFEHRLAAAQCEVLAAAVLLASREAMDATKHLDNPQRDPDHLNPAEGGNMAADDYWRER